MIEYVELQWKDIKYMEEEQTNKILTAAVVQVKTYPGKIRNNVDRTMLHFNSAASQGADLIILPEIFHSGYDIGVLKKDIALLAQDQDGKMMKTFCGLCEKWRVCAVIPFIEKTKGKFFNSVAWIDKNGYIRHIYRKRNLWREEHQVFTPGDEPPLIIDTEWGKFALMICYDIDFPEMARYAALNDAELIILPAAWEYKNKGLWDIFLSSRAAENMMFLISANLYQPVKGLHMFGNSRILNPRGTIIAQLPVDCEDVLICKIDLSHVARYRTEFPYLKDRKIDF